MTTKRIFDVIVSLCALILCAPLIGVAAVLIRWDSKGPVFFRQVRIGQRFQPFKVLKLRTMVTGADVQEQFITAADDPRVTRVGRWFRNCKLDELPQLVNVIKGEMSLVGPRPEVRRYVELNRFDYDVILTAKPGITDEASLKYHSEEEILASARDPEQEYVTKILPDKIRRAKHYVARPSLITDVLLIWRTMLITVCCVLSVKYCGIVERR